MKLTKELIGQSFPIIKLPKRKVKDLSIGQFYEVVEIKSKTLIIRDDSDNEISVYPSFIDFENPLSDKEDAKSEFEENNLEFDWIDENLNIVLPEEYKASNNEDDIKETGWLIKADAFSKGAEMKESQFKLMIDYLKRKNKIEEYQSVMTESERREHSRTTIIDGLLS